MNLMHLKYVVEVDKTKNFSKAAENLFMGQPNLSRAIKELEQTIGIVIFKRTTKGIETTEDGAEFILYAKKILDDVERVKKRYTEKNIRKERFSILVPRASYISQAFVEFSNGLNQEYPIEVIYKETNSSKVVNKVLQGEYRLGIVRYRDVFDKEYKKMFEDKGLSSDLIFDFQYRIIVHKDNPIAKLSEISLAELNNYVELCHPDPYVPNVPLSDVKKIEFSSEINKRIYIYERATQFELLEKVNNSFMLVSPMPKELLEKYNLVELKCVNIDSNYKDVLIFKKGYKFTEIDKRFLTILCDEKRKIEKDY